jgi:cellulose synthase/poly-beta-1,6-N-acetylglucosamine synthase-like glycosyltransferase
VSRIPGHFIPHRVSRSAYPLPGLYFAPPMPSSAPYVSVVVPVFNEEANLVPLHARIASALASVPGGWELILVDDGSRDRSVEVLRRLQAQDPDHVRVVELLRNFGQHAAVFAGMSVVRGQAVVTLDADLQNPRRRSRGSSRRWRKATTWSAATAASGRTRSSAAPPRAS